jgi:hypothetical protein
VASRLLPRFLGSVGEHAGRRHAARGLRGARRWADRGSAGGRCARRRHRWLAPRRRSGRRARTLERWRPRIVNGDDLPSRPQDAGYGSAHPRAEFLDLKPAAGVHSTTANSNGSDVVGVFRAPSAWRGDRNVSEHVHCCTAIVRNWLPQARVLAASFFTPIPMCGDPSRAHHGLVRQSVRGRSGLGHGAHRPSLSVQRAGGWGATR